jgi:hypothetical protein
MENLEIEKQEIQNEEVKVEEVKVEDKKEVKEEVVDYNFQGLKRGETCPKTGSVKALPSFSIVSDERTKKLNTIYIKIQETLIHANNVLQNVKEENEKQTKMQEVELLLKSHISYFSYEAFEISSQYPAFPLILMKKLRNDSLLYLPLWRTIEEICDFLTKLLREYKEIHLPLIGKKHNLANLLN